MTDERLIEQVLARYVRAADRRSSADMRPSEVQGGQAMLDAQFIVYNTVGLAQPEHGWPPGANGAQGTVQPIEAGYYRSQLRKIDGGWKIVQHRITHDLPYAFPGA